MPNQLSFEVEFKREDLLEILDNPNAELICVYGTYTYRPDVGKNAWAMDAFAAGCDKTKTIFAPQKIGCIKPCPTT